MIEILKAEFSYNRLTLSLFLLVAPIFYIFRYIDMEYFNPLSALWYLPFLMLNQIFVFRYKEKRDRFFSLLPVTQFHLASVRILSIILPCTGLYIIYAVSYFLFSPGNEPFFSVLNINIGLIFSIYFLYFFIHDLLYVYLKRMGITTLKMLFISALLLLVLSLVGTLLALDKMPLPVKNGIDSIIGFIVEHNVFAGAYGSVKFLAISFVFLCFTVPAFMRKKTSIK